MNPRLEKLRQEREKLAEKLASLTARLKALDEQILKLENTDIVGIVRENGLTIEQLAADGDAGKASHGGAARRIQKNGGFYG